MNNLSDDTTKKSHSDDTTQESVTVRSGGKEGEAITPREKPEITETGTTEVSPEAKEAGVEAKKDYVDIPPDVKKLGVTHSGSSAPVSEVVTGGPELPLSDDQIEEGSHAPATSSFAWLAQWCMRQLKRAHIVIRKVHGKIRRTKV